MGPKIHPLDSFQIPVITGTKTVGTATTNYNFIVRNVANASISGKQTYKSMLGLTV